jgi:hypothetical protein
LKHRPQPHQFPAWSIKGAAFAIAPIELTHWEKFLLDEGIEEDRIKNNAKVKAFVALNADLYFIPVKVLEMYGVTVDE